MKNLTFFKYALIQEKFGTGVLKIKYGWHFRGPTSVFVVSWNLRNSRRQHAGGKNLKIPFCCLLWGRKDHPGLSFCVVFYTYFSQKWFACFKKTGCQACLVTLNWGGYVHKPPRVCEKDFFRNLYLSNGANEMSKLRKKKSGSNRVYVFWRFVSQKNKLDASIGSTNTKLSEEWSFFLAIQFWKPGSPPPPAAGGGPFSLPSLQFLHQIKKNLKKSPAPSTLVSFSSHCRALSRFAPPPTTTYHSQKKYDGNRAETTKVFRNYWSQNSCGTNVNEI